MKHDLFGKLASTFPDHALEFQTDFSEMLPACFISEGVSYLVEVEAAINDRFDVNSVDCPDEILLMLAATDDQALEPCLSDHQLHGRDFAGAASQDADHSNVTADRHGSMDWGRVPGPPTSMTWSTPTPLVHSRTNAPQSGW